MSLKGCSRFWDVDPYRGVGPILFGMTRQQLLVLADFEGAKSGTGDGDLWTSDLQCQVCFERALPVIAEITVTHGPRGVTLGGIDVLRDPLALTKLARLDGDPWWDPEDESFLFPRLGVCTNDYRVADFENESRIVTAFRYNRYDMARFQRWDADMVQ